MLKGSAEVACFLLTASISFAAAEPSPSPVADGGLPREAQFVNGVLVPVPTEIFRVLDKFRDSNWKAVSRPELAVMRPAGSSAKIALSLGLVIGEGFVTVAAKDDAEMQDLGKTALKLAHALGVEKAMLRREKSIIDHADKKEWPAVRKEWSGVEGDLKQAMGEIKSEPLSQLVSLGGWLRGIDALSVLVSQHYSPENARLLYQPVLLDFFGERLSKMKSRLRKDPIIGEMEKGVAQLRPLIGSAHGNELSNQEVRKIHEISANLINSICSERSR